MKSMDTEQLAEELEILIQTSKVREVKELLENISSGNGMRDIEKQFADRDPVVAAIDSKEEDIALYLINKGFNHSKLYSYSDKVCNQWCYNNHHGDKCPSEYDALELAQSQGLHRVVTLIQEIQKGLLKPGETLTKTKHVSPAPSGGSLMKTKHVSPALSGGSRSTVKRKITKNGNTALHHSVLTSPSPAMVHVCTKQGICINTQNFDGDTALHIAVSRHLPDVAKALLMNGSDLTIRNKLGQTPLDQSQGTMRSLLESFKCGLLAAITKGEQPAMQRIIRLLPNPDAVVKAEVSALQLAKNYSNKGQGHQACHNLLQGHLPTLRLVHAVLGEDMDQFKNILKTEASWNINVRYKDKYGETPLSCAIEQHNMALVQLLMETGKCHVNIRVRENSWTDATVPLYFKTLEKDCPTEIWRYFVNNAENLSLTDRDCHGNTCLLRAVINGKTSEFIHSLLTTCGGHIITHRNAEGLHARELAKMLGIDDIVETIDEFICDHPKYFLMTLPVASYGQQNLNIHGIKLNKNLLDIAIQNGVEQDVLAVKHYPNIEALGNKLFMAAADGDVKTTAKLCTANYQDKQGRTALTYAIVFNQTETVEILLTARPGLCNIPDNHGRIPLHYAYALPEAQSNQFVHMLLDRISGPNNQEHCPDKDGREPAEYQHLRTSDEIVEMLQNIQDTLNIQDVVL